MAFKLRDFVAEASVTTGTGTYTLAGALADYDTFSGFLSNSDTTFYFARLGSDWEAGIGTYSSGTLARTTILASTNANAAVNWLDASAKRIYCGLPSSMSGAITPWVTYTPTYTAFGTVTGSSMWWRRIGDTCHLRGNFTSGTSIGSEARMSLPSGLSSDATKVPALQLAGKFLFNAAYAYQANVIIGSNLAYVNFSIQDGTYSGLVARTGSNMISSGVTASLTAEIPISGW